ncbi:hypothetical protein [Prosthecobacter sp.]|nr:hypothetical protein [Prosthecobacter sp.]MDZ4405471.1 hypothetical protein [Prosthecobacter sp.]
MNDEQITFDPRVAEYDAWYQTPRGQWIGQTEFALLKSMRRRKVCFI